MDELSYRPGLGKLIYHLEHLEKIRTQQPVGPIHLSVFPTNFCQLNCKYCCFGKTQRTDEQLSLKDFRIAVDTLCDFGLKAVEESGGGDPLLWSEFIPATEYAHKKGLKLSLVTNGLALRKIPQDTLKKFSWIRISVQSTSYAKTIDMDYIPSGVKKSMSFIVYDAKSIVELEKLHNFAKEKNIVVRIAPKRPCNLSFEKDVELVAKKLGKPFLFFNKERGSPSGCYMIYIRAALNWKGEFLPCPSIELSPENAGKIPDYFGVCKANEIRDWLLQNSPHDLGYRCEFCNCGADSNNFIHNLLEKVEDVDFV